MTLFFRSICIANMVMYKNVGQSLILSAKQSRFCVFVRTWFAEFLTFIATCFSRNHYCRRFAKIDPWICFWYTKSEWNINGPPLIDDETRFVCGRVGVGRSITTVMLEEVELVVEGALVVFIEHSAWVLYAGPLFAGYIILANWWYLLSFCCDLVLDSYWTNFSNWRVQMQILEVGVMGNDVLNGAISSQVCHISYWILLNCHVVGRVQW